MQCGGAPTLLRPATQQGGGGEVRAWQEEPGGDGGESGGQEGFLKEGVKGRVRQVDGCEERG